MRWSRLGLPALVLVGGVTLLTGCLATTYLDLPEEPSWPPPTPAFEGPRAALSLRQVRGTPADGANEVYRESGLFASASSDPEAVDDADLIVGSIQGCHPSVDSGALTFLTLGLLPSYRTERCSMRIGFFGTDGEEIYKTRLDWRERTYFGWSALLFGDRARRRPPTPERVALSRAARHIDQWNHARSRSRVSRSTPIGKAVVPTGPPRVPSAPITSLSDLGRYHALVIGNEAYASLPDLQTAHRDSRAIAELLRDDYGFDVRLILDGRREELVSALSELRARLGERDNLLIYYAGHGLNDEEAGEAYWLPVDAERHQPTNWISNSTVTQQVRAMRARHVLVVADSCFSGTLTRGIAMPPRSTRWLAKLAARRSRTALTSGANEPVVDGGGGGHSVFARALLDALATNEGILDATSLYANIRRQVMLDAWQSPQYGDIRLAGHEQGDFLFARPQ